MITAEINDWIKRVEKYNYNSQDIMEEFIRLSRYLTREEMIQIKNRLNKNLQK